MQLEITALDNEPLGALVTGWQPEETLDDGTAQQLRSALAEHLVLVFRGHRQPTDTELVDFAETFGNLIKGSEWFRDVGDRPEILPVTNALGADGLPQGTGGAGPLEWHADYSYVPRPGKESFLNAVELPPDAPRTYFCSQYTVLEDLPPQLVDRLRGLRAVHSITGYVKRDEGPDDHRVRNEFLAKKRRDEAAGVERPDIPEAEHPVIVRHPETDREILYVSRGITKQILGMAREESSALLKELHDRSTTAERVYAHEWQVGDMVMFDTLGALHRRDAWDPSGIRVMRQLSTTC